MELVEEKVLRDETEMTFDEVREKWDNLVWKIANELLNTQKNYGLKDLYTFGLFGLWKASDNYNPEKGASFKTHAYTSIEGHIKNEINAEKKGILCLSRSKVKRKEEVYSLMLQKQANNWTLEETIEKSGLTKEEWVEAIELIQGTVSLNKKVMGINNDRKEKELIEILPADLGIEEKSYQKELVDEIISSLEDEFEKDVIHLRFFEGHNIERTAELLQIPRTTYYRKEKRLLSKIKNKQQNGSLHM